MPEVKRREIQRRRDRREKLWRDDDGDDDEGDDENGPSGGGGGGALRRAAKKILVRRLKEMREKEASMRKEEAKTRQRKRNGSDDDVEIVKGRDDINDIASVRTTTNDSGALAAGFTLEDDDEYLYDESIRISKRPPANVGDVTSIEGDNSGDHERSEEDRIGFQQHQRDDDDGGNDDGDYENEENHFENDWEMSRAIQSSIDDVKDRRRRKRRGSADGDHGHADYDDDDAASDGNAYDDTFVERRRDDLIRHDADNEIIASLPSETRHQWIDSQYRAHRIQSRSECIRAAADPGEYSSTQLRNFLKNSMLTKRLGEIGKLVETRKEFRAYGGGSAVENMSNDNENTPRHRGLKRLKRHNEDASSDDDNDDTIFETTSVDKIAPSMKVLFGEDDSDSDDDSVIDDGYGCDGGFFLSSAKAAVTPQNESTKDDVIDLLESDSENDDNNSTARSSINKSPLPKVNDCTDRTCNKRARGGVPLPSNPSDTVTALQSSKLLFDLFTADQEWAEWGNEVDEKAVSMQVVANDLNRAVAKNDGLPEEPDVHDSDSDEDAQDGVTFLTLGNAAKPADISRDNKLSATVVSIFPTASDAALPITSDIIEGDDEDVDVEWEDCNSEDDQSGNEIDEISLEVKDSVQTEIDPCETADSSKSSPTPIVNEEESLVSIDSTSECASGDDELDAPVDDPQAAALKRAQVTASNLTSWAGRAFQRAISEFAADQTQPDSSNQDTHQVNTGKERIESATDQKGIDTDFGQKAQSEKIGASTDDNHDSPASPHHIKKKPFFLDTSLEGLTEAHTAILEQEKTMERDMSTITDEMKEDILSLLQLCGIPWVESPTEAEAQCAALEELGLVDGIVTEDSDIFVFGGKKVYKNFFDEQKYVEAYFAKDIERDLALKRHQLVALAMLLGGDYTDGVKGVGIVNGMEVLQTFTIHDSDEGISDGLQRFREWLDGFGYPSSDVCDDVSSQRVALFHKKHKSARTRWVAPSDFPSRGIMNAYLNPVVDKSETKFSWATPNLQGLQHFCAETLGWERAETDRVVNPVLKVLDSGSTQMRLESYFLRYEDGYKFAKVKSKRLKAVLHDIRRGDTADTVDASTADNAEMATSNNNRSATHKEK
jgi:hypothetical protein